MYVLYKLFLLCINLLYNCFEMLIWNIFVSIWRSFFKFLIDWDNFLFFNIMLLVKMYFFKVFFCVIFNDKRWLLRKILILYVFFLICIFLEIICFLIIVLIVWYWMFLLVKSYFLWFIIVFFYIWNMLYDIKNEWNIDSVNFYNSKCS